MHEGPSCRGGAMSDSMEAARQRAAERSANAWRTTTTKAKPRSDADRVDRVDGDPIASARERCATASANAWRATTRGLGLGLGR